MSTSVMLTVGGCAVWGGSVDECAEIDATVHNGAVDLGGKSRGNGSDGTGRADQASSSNGGDEVPTPNSVEEEEVRDNWDKVGPDGQPITRLFDEIGVIDPPTLEDLRSFHPQVGVSHGEPNGWSIVGLPTNFYASAQAHVEEGTLLGQPAAVRFTPTGYRWTYGDGTSSLLSGAGASWRALGLEEFDATSTSHIFTKAGTYSVQLAVDYGAEYQFAGDPWVEVDGVLTIPTGVTSVVVGTAETVLVSGDCTRNPAGPGC